jgi:predicted porin
MKKTLIALAALATTAAFAQSSVTLYGKANIGLQKTSGSDTRLTGGADGSDSRFGLRGSEDLGGGLKANFTFESGFDPANGVADGQVLSVDPDTGAVTRRNQGLFQRQAWVGLSGGFGELRLGRQYTVSFDTSIGYMPSTYASAQLNTGLGFNGGPSRTNGQIRYISPSFGGVKVHVATQLKANANVSDATFSELAVAYANGPIKAALAVSKVRDGDGTNAALNGSYDFGSFLVGAGYIKQADDNRSVTGSGGKGGWIHVAGNFSGFTPYIQYATNTEADIDAIEVGVRYALSKRTGFYLHASRTEPDVGDKVNRVALGIDHNF